MYKVLSVRPNKHIMSLLLEIQKYLPDTNRTEIINLGLSKAINKGIKWKEVSQDNYRIHHNLEMPDFMQIKIEEESYKIMFDEIIESFKEQDLKRVTAPYLIKLVLINYLNSLKEKLKEKDVLKPIKEKLEEWINYEKNIPKCSYKGNEIVHDIYRALNDSDCQLTNGNLMADTIFSLWIPMKMSLQCSETYPYKCQGNKFYPYKQDGYISKTGNTINFLTDIQKNLETYLPPNEWEKLYEFAELASTRANVMILPDRKMQSRGILFLDQMPKTIYECFKGGDLNQYFNNEESLVTEWIQEEKLGLFFDGEIKKENIKPIIEKMEANEVHWLKDKNEISEMLDNFINILKLRGKE